MFPEENKPILQKVIASLVELYGHDLAGRDMQGDLYAYMLSKIQTAGVNGQFRTPKHIREMTVGLVKPTPDDLICDPACGTAGFLISSAEYLREHYEADMTAEQWERFAGDAYTGFDAEPTMQRIAAMNLMLRAITKPTVERRDGVSKSNADATQYDVVLATPPVQRRGGCGEHSVGAGILHRAGGKHGAFRLPPTL